MTGNKRPLSVTILGWLYIGVGIIGFTYHFTEIRATGAFQYDSIWVELVRLLSVLAGVFMLRGHNWASWLALAWIAFHVVVGALNGPMQFAIHCLFCALIAWILFRPATARYFRGANKLT